ncbi:Os08g0520700, partial [Oryza sativa Japonica Group]
PVRRAPRRAQADGLHLLATGAGAGVGIVVPRVAPVSDAAGLHQHRPLAGLLGGDEVHQDVLAVALPVHHGARRGELRRAGVLAEEARAEDEELGEHHGVARLLPRRRAVRPPPAGQVEVVGPREEPDEGARAGALLPGGEREGERGGVREHVVVGDGHGGGADGRVREEAGVEGGGGGAVEGDGRREA